MAYTSRKAVEVIEGYFNEINASYELIDNSKKRGFLVKIDDASKIVIFVSPLVHKVDGTKNYFDTRDSAPDARELVWNYAQKNNYKFFHLGINDEVPKYKDYIFSLEADEDYVQKFSGTEHGERVGPGNQVIIPNDFIPAKNFERINNRALIYISVIHKSFLKEYLTFYDNRPYSGTDIPDQNENEITADNKLADNFLLYGVPGCGKSFYVEKHYESKVEEGFTIRVVFHPDYTYSDFVGQVMPILKTIPNEQGEDEKKLEYEFVPGPFTQILHTAYLEPEKQCLLIIEELNRGNAPAIFGEIFQLLDRNDNGESKYGIYNADIAKYAYTDLTKYDGWQEEAVAKEPIKLPPNLTIVATMNTSDQNVFTMDTAFQRRWQMKHIPNRFTGESLDEKTINHVAKYLPNSEISWGVFAQTVNKKMHTANLGFGGTEDKSLGVYFATDNDLDDAERFAEKVLKYLWDDAFKLGRKELFNDCSQGLSAVIEAYEDAKGDPLKKVLVPEVYNEMQKKMAEMAAEQAKTAEAETSEEEAAESAAEDNPAQKPAGEE
ncbi:AAA family ATPase [Phascolarctobacterium succinatutens]|uniref:AAA family ATPase n=1 Tax=Phascolarctobacterium succinatutens TaxID=626940 RepID=UPI003AAF431D